MVAAGSGGQGARDVLEEIGGNIQKEVHKEVDAYREKLKGNLSDAKFLGVSHVSSDPCDLDHEIHTNVTTGKDDPCHRRWPVRFSDESRSQCTDNRIKDSTTENIGACAPYRRLHVCDQNLEQIKPHQITSTHNLLADVCLAAQHEGKSLVENYEEYKKAHNDSDICTVLARSFADIGDIVRGKDLYLGDKKEKKQLEENLKRIFKKIYEGLTKDNDNGAIKTRYQNDNEDFFQLREDWWNANRNDIWKALTCDAPKDAQYTKKGPHNHITESNMGRCRCITGDPPTNMDYVPQYLRWFDEWSEEFCRKRKKKLENAIEKCRGQDGSGNERYCDLNGYDCKGTFRANDEYSISIDCAKCFFSCHRYVKWIDNQKLEFEKQKDKYDKEIAESNKTTKEYKNSTINNIYAKQFYDQLKKKCGTVEKFVQLLNEQKECKNHPKIKEKNYIDFRDKPEDIFFHTEYCQACPWCGLDCSNGKCKEINGTDPRCKKDTDYKPSAGAKCTEIDVLYTREGNKEILDKLSEFCKSDSKTGIQNEHWKCYKKENNNKCVFENGKELGGEKKVKDYDDFMMFWINHMLKDSIDWRNEIIKCVNKGKLMTCKKGCKSKCDCFQKWINKKQKEWNQIKEHYKNETDIKLGDPYDILEYILEEDFLKEIKEAYGNAEAIDRIKKLKEIHHSKPKEDVATAKYAIDILLEHEKKEAESCLKNQEQDDCPDEESEDEDEEETHNVKDNPCRGSSGVQPIKNVKEIAKMLQREAKTHMIENSVVNGENKLKADISKATFRRGGNGSKLANGNICKIDENKHSNATNKSNNPCNGKDNEKKRFVVGTKWEGGDFVNKTHEDVYMPPRREHMCTSNLENLDVGSVTENGKAIHSLLGDVLLTAKMDAAEIINRYKSQNSIGDPIDKKHQESICRAIRYSFADLGDIIKGRDLWDEDSGEKTTQGKVEKIFDNIYNNNSYIKEKYKKIEDQKHLHLREDWWEANRKDVWRAMKCATTSGKIPCSIVTPLDDYIPQRLRWMTEWAEWFCKMQSQEYSKLVADCKSCKGKGQGDGKDCTQKDKECNDCKQACDAYNTKIRTWRKQWQQMEIQYTPLYLQAQTTSDSDRPSVYGGPKDQYVIDFFKKLQKANGDTTLVDTTSPYFTAAGYIHQELTPHMQCQGQTKFCTGDDTYTFKYPPKGYEEACICDKRNKPEPKKQKGACKIVEVILKGNNGTAKVGECNPKDQGSSYPGWDCTNEKLVSGKGECMPPRRQKLCVHYLTKLNDDSKEEDLREAFIKSAAAETFLSWQYYNKMNGDDAHLLESVTIPPQFLTSMFYTFGDYRDIFLGTDISSDSNIHVISQKVKDILNSENMNSHEQNITPKTWWENHGTDIWKGMLCALEYDENKGKLESIPAPEVFAERPQFLRWFVEWGDEYCEKRKALEKNVKQSCKEFNSGYKKKNNGSCAEACKKYKEYITKKKEQYNTQNDKFQSDKKDKKPGYDNISSKDASDYLKHKCLDKKCECMGNVNRASDYWDKPFDTYDDNTLKGNCEFATSPYSSPSQKGKMSCVEQVAKELRKKAEENVEKIDSSMKGNESKINGTCNLIKKQTHKKGQTTCDFNKRYPNGITSLDSSCDNKEEDRFKIGEKWDCVGDTTDVKNKLCIPPRRKDMCLNKLKNISVNDISDSTKLLQKIQYVAQNEGDDIIKNLLPENPCNESVICDAMKYSFADLGDIIRGRSKIKPNNGDNIEGELQNIFRKIQNNTTSLKSIELTEFREKWWDANRKEVWKAMTCNAPNDAHLKKKKNNPGNKSQIIASQTEQTKKCSHDSEPPDYDYIPERYRFLQEWSEYYCKVLKEKQYEMKNECEKCKTKNVMCENDNNILCNECKDKCKIYKELVNQWESQFDEQNQIYKQLYMKAKTAISTDANSDSSIKFLKKLEESCDNPYSAEKYLDISTHCTDYKFSETNNNENDAFSKYPKDYKDKCKCKEKTSTSGSDNNLTSFIQNSLNFPKIPGLKKVTKIAPQIPRTIKNIMPDAHTIHAIVAKSFPYFVPLFQEDDKTPPTNNILNDVLPSAIPVGIALALTSIAFLYLKKKTKSSVGNLFQILHIPKSDYDIPTLKSKNRYIPYRSGTYKGKTYIYMEGDSDEDKYAFMSDTTDVTSSESEYEEMDINEIYPYQSPKYKTLIEVVLEPSGNNTTASGKNTPSDTQNDIQNDGIPSNKFSDNEWNTLKDEFISNMLQNQPNDIPNDYKSGNSSTNTNITTTSRHNVEEKPFIMSIHDRNLYTGEEYSYNVNMSTNSMDDPKYVSNNVYSGIDLINDTLSGNQHIDIYDELLKRKENELFGTNHVKQTSIHSVAKLTNSDPIHNQLELFHKWLDRHRNMCEKWENHHERLAKLKELWENETHSGNTHPSDSNKTLNTDVSIQIDMDNPKPINQFNNMDTILEDLDKYNEPYYDVQDDIYYDVNDHDTSTVDSNAVNVPSKVQIEMDVNIKLVKEKYPIADVWDI